jgi:hypothetical protein
MQGSAPADQPHLQQSVELFTATLGHSDLLHGGTSATSTEPEQPPGLSPPSRFNHPNLKNPSTLCYLYTKALTVSCKHTLQEVGATERAFLGNQRQDQDTVLHPDGWGRRGR